MLAVACATTPAPAPDPEPPDLVCERECRIEHQHCADRPYWQQCESDLGECLDACL